MSVILYEKAKSRDTVIDLRSGSTTVEYAAHVVPPYDASDYEDLMTAVSLTAPLRNGFQLRRGWEIKHQGGHFWLVTVHYGFDELDAVDPGAGDLLTGAFSFETAGGTQHITQSLGTVSAVKRGANTSVRSVTDGVVAGASTTFTSATAAFTAADVGAEIIGTGLSAAIWPVGTYIVSITSATAVITSAASTLTGSAEHVSIGIAQPLNHARAIGVTKDGVSGCDKIAPKLEWQLTRRFLGITIAYIGLLREMVGTMNDGDFYGHAAGECLLIGASGAPSQNNQSTSTPEALVTFKFASSPTQTAIDVGGDGELVVPIKAGWDYLWVEYEDIVDATSRRRFSRPRSAYVERIYDPEDFSSLGIGVSP